MVNVYEQVADNQRKSLFIVIAFVAFIALTAYVLVQGLGLDPSWLGIALIFAGFSTLGSYYFSDKIILGLSGAHPADPNEDRVLYSVTENMARVARVPLPKLYILEDPALNAFATGRDPEHAAIAVTRGLLNRLNRTQLEGVVGHEISHVVDYDTRLMSIVTILVGFVAIITDWFWRASFWGIGGRRRNDDRDSEGGQLQLILFIVGIVLAILAPFIATLIKLAISRRREFLADASSAKLTRYPEGLIQALQIISEDPVPLKSASTATAHLYISNPFKDGKGIGQSITNLFNTHPPIEERIAALQQEL